MKYTILLFAALLFLANSALSKEEKKTSLQKEEDKKAAMVIEKLQKNYENIKTYSSDFTQAYINKYLVKGLKYSGKVYFMKPGKMKWLYNSPENKEIISDGKTLWLYKPEDKQVMITTNIDKDQVAGISFLWGEGKLLDTFFAEFLYEDKEKKQYCIALKSKGKQDYYLKLHFFIDSTTFKVTQIQIYEVAGNINQIEFSNTTDNLKLASDFFDFKADKDVKVITAPSMPQLQK